VGDRAIGTPEPTPSRRLTISFVTDHAVEERYYATDIRATVMKQLVLNPRRLEVPGQKRLEIDYGNPIEEIIAKWGIAKQSGSWP
jgi:hypothetical protein